MSIGSQIKHYRKKLNLKYRELGDACLVDGKTISALEKRDSNRSEFFPAIALAFGLTLEQLADESTDYPVQLCDMSKISLKNTPPRRQHDYWPFKNVTPAQYELLQDDECDMIENHVLLFIRARGDPSKQDAPAAKSLGT